MRLPTIPSWSIGLVFATGLAWIAPAAAQTVLPLPGKAVDLSVTAAGDLLVVTTQGDVLEITTSGSTTTLAAPGQFAQTLVAGVSLATGSAAVIDSVGSIYEVGTVPGVPQLVYGDAYLVREPTDLLIDPSGRFLVPCKTVSNDTRCVARMSADGSRWAYFFVGRSPIAGATDPVTGNLFLTDSVGQFDILGQDAEGAPVVTPIGSASGFSVANLDGDVAMTASGDCYYAAGTTVKRWFRSTGSTTTISGFAGNVRGLAIAGSSTGMGSSLWLVEGNTSTLRELAIADGPGPALATDFGAVPGTGTEIVSFAFNANDMATDLDGELLVGGDVFGSNNRIDRIALPSLAKTTVATSANGLTSRVEGLEVAPDGTIFALTRFGQVYTVVEGGGPPVVGAYFTDPSDQVVVGKDLLLGRDGTLYLSDRQAWSFGLVSRIDPAGQWSSMIAVEDTRGVLADPFGARLLANEWNSTGFAGTVGVVNEVNGTLDDLPGFTAVNWSNQENHGDGDMVMDATGRIYTSAEDEFAVLVWNPATSRTRRIGSGYLGNPGGLAIARSTDALTSPTGWSLYVAQWNRLHEIPGVAPEAPTLLDRDAPGIGKLLSYVRPEWGRPVAFAHDPSTNSLVAVTDATRVVAFPLDGSAPSVIADTVSGLAGDLSAIAVESSGDLLVGEAAGTVYELDALGGYAASVVFADPLDEIADLREIVHDATRGTYLLDAAPTSTGVGSLFSLSNGSLTRLAAPWNPCGAALDPTTGDAFVAQGETPKSLGEILRLHLGASPVMANHWPPSDYETFELSGATRAIGFDGDGDLFVASDTSGRVHVVDRATRTVSLVAGNYTSPRDVLVAPGRPGVAGANGASLFVLDGWCVYEHGVDGALPPATATVALEDDPFMVPALFQFGGGNTLHLESPGDANRLFLVVPSRFGQLTGFPISALGGNVADTRVLWQDFDTLWLDAIAGASPFLGFFNLMDPFGVPVTPITFDLPALPQFTGLGAMIDLTWASFDPIEPNGIGTVGGTSQIRVGL
ncbi:MAG: hypothetical protein R3F34_01215 [Planctomycetota bacterium]